jgi:hypothetical protein
MAYEGLRPYEYVSLYPVELMLGLAESKQKAYDTNIQTINQIAAQVADLSFEKPEHKKRFAELLNETKKRLSIYSMGDFSNSQLTSSVQRMVLDVTKDPVIRAGIMSKANLQKELEFMEKQRQEGKLSPTNELVFNLRYQEWLNDKNPTSVFKAKYVPYINLTEVLSKRVKDFMKEDEIKIETPYKVDENGQIVYQNGKPVLSPAMQVNKLKYLSGSKIYNYILGTLTEQERQQLLIDSEAKTLGMKPEDIFNLEYTGVENQIKTTESDIKLTEKAIEAYSKQYSKEDLDKIIAGSGIDDLRNKLNKLKERKSTLDKIKEEKGIEEYVKTQGKTYYTNTYAENYAVELAKGLAFEVKEREYKENPFIQYALEKEKIELQRQRNLIDLQRFAEELKRTNVEVSVNYADPVKTSGIDLLQRSVDELNQLQTDISNRKTKLENKLAEYNKGVSKDGKSYSTIEQIEGAIQKGENLPTDIANLYKEYSDLKNKYNRKELALKGVLNKATRLALERSKSVGEEEKKEMLSLYKEDTKTPNITAEADELSKGENTKKFYELLSSKRLYNLETKDSSDKVKIYYSPDYNEEKPLRVRLYKSVPTVRNEGFAKYIDITVYGNKNKDFINLSDKENIIHDLKKSPHFNNALSEIYHEGQKLSVQIAPTKDEGKSVSDNYSRIAGKILTLANRDNIVDRTPEGNYEKSKGEILLKDPEKEGNKIPATEYVKKMLKGGPITFKVDPDGTHVAEVGAVRIPIPKGELSYIVQLASDPTNPNAEKFNAIMLEPELLDALEHGGTTYGDIENIYGDNYLRAYFKKDEDSVVTKYPVAELSFGEKNERNGKYEVVAYDIMKTGEKMYSAKIYVKDPMGNIIVVYDKNNYSNAADVVNSINTLYNSEVIKNGIISKLGLSKNKQ